MKRRITNFMLLLLMFIALTTISCDVFKTPLSNENPDDNPLDPDNPDYEPPLATIIEGPSDESTITTDVVTFRWTGNNNDCLFSYRLNNSTWSDWSTDTVVTLDYLDEVEHVFQVMAKYPTDSIQHIPDERSFTVDAIKGPALWLYHKKVETTVNDTFSVKVMVDEVTDLAMMSIVLNFDPTYLQIQEYSVLENSTLLDGKDLIQVDQYDNNTGQLELYLALASNSQQSINDSGAIIHLVLQSIKSGITDIQYSSGCDFRKYDNSQIQIISISNSSIFISS